MENRPTFLRSSHTVHIGLRATFCCCRGEDGKVPLGGVRELTKLLGFLNDIPIENAIVFKTLTFEKVTKNALQISE